MKPTSTSASLPRRRHFHSPDYYPPRQEKRFRDMNLGGFLITLLAAAVVFGVVLVTH